jgi:hypothetical protein
MRRVPNASDPLHNRWLTIHGLIFVCLFNVCLVWR